MISKQNETIGSGKVFAALLNSATLRPVGGYRHLGNTPAFGVNMTKNKATLWDSDSNERFIRATRNISSEQTLNIELTDMNTENMAFVFGAKAPQTITQSATASVTETIENIVLERWYILGESDQNPMGVKALDTVSLVSGATELEEDVDFIVDKAKAKVKFITGGAVAADESAAVTYGLRAGTFERIITGNESVWVAIRFETDNIQGSNHIYKWMLVDLASNGDIALKSGEEFMTASLTGTVMKHDDYPMMIRDGEVYTL